MYHKTPLAIVKCHIPPPVILQHTQLSAVVIMGHIRLFQQDGELAAFSVATTIYNCFTPEAEGAGLKRQFLRSSGGVPALLLRFVRPSFGLEEAV